MVIYFAFIIAFVSVVVAYILSNQGLVQGRFASSGALSLAGKLGDYLGSIVQSEYADVTIAIPPELGGYPYNITFSNRKVGAINLQNSQSYTFPMPVTNVSAFGSSAPLQAITVNASAGQLHVSYNATTETLSFG